jgi:hypothetical protein
MTCPTLDLSNAEKAARRTLINERFANAMNLLLFFFLVPLFLKESSWDVNPTVKSFS